MNWAKALHVRPRPVRHNLSYEMKMSESSSLLVTTSFQVVFAFLLSQCAGSRRSLRDRAAMGARLIESRCINNYSRAVRCIRVKGLLKKNTKSHL